MNHRHQRLFIQNLIPSLLGTLISACGDPMGTSDSATDAVETMSPTTGNPTTGGPIDPTGGPVPSIYCAIPEFSGSQTEGKRYICEGGINAGKIDFLYCDSDTTPCNTPDQIIIHSRPFPVVPTEGDCPVEPYVEACCLEAVEDTGGVPEEVESACLSDCAHKACANALEELRDLAFSPDFLARCDGSTDVLACKANLKTSLEYYESQLLDTFQMCVNSVVDPQKTISLGTPPCLGEGCLHGLVLDLSCNIDEVEFGTTPEGEQTCTEAKHQPPPKLEPSCAITGGDASLSNGTTTWNTTVIEGSASYRNFYCDGPGCTFALDTLDLEIADFVVDDYALSNIQVTLRTPALGRSDGEVVTFPPGAIRVDITADTRWIGAGPPPFGQYDIPFGDTTSNSTTATASFANGRFTLDEVTLGFDTFSITASLDPATCSGLLPLDWLDLGFPDDEETVSWVKTDPEDDDIVYVGYNGGVMISFDGANPETMVWETIATGMDMSESRFAIDPNDPETLYAVIGTQIFVSHDRGATPFTLLTEQLPTGLGITVLHASADGSLYVGTSYKFGPPADPGSPGVYKWDGGPGPFVELPFDEDEYEDPGSAYSLFAHVIAEDAAKGILYYGGEITPIPDLNGYDAPNMRSVSGGPWSNMNAGLLDWHVTSINVDPNNSKVYAKEENSTLWESDDSGACWLPLTGHEALSIVLDLNDTTRMFAGAPAPSMSFPTRRGGVWVSTDGGRHFAAAGLQAGHPEPADPARDTTSVALNSSSTRIFATGSQGDVGLWTAPIPTNL